MKKIIKLNPTKLFEVPKGYRIGRVIINGRSIERRFEILKKQL